MKAKHTYDQYDAADYYDAITVLSEASPETAYYLLKHRLKPALSTIYHNLDGLGGEEFDDTLDDFFLYLYEGHPSKEPTKPFEMLGRVRNKKAFFRWVLVTYRYFLLKRACAEKRRQDSLSGLSATIGDDKGSLTDETMTRYLATAIAYVDQEFTPRNRFIFYRILLTFLDRRLAIPQETVANVLEMNPVTYRVSSKRQKDRFLGFVDQLEKGIHLPLDVKHQQIRDRLIEQFDSLYEILESYYEIAIKEMPMLEEFQRLRLYLSEERGFLMHESRPAYGYGQVLHIRQIYDSLKRSWSSREGIPRPPETGRGQGQTLLPSNGLSGQ